uniref:Uncharacterized protein n=1 Tax=Meloidogyne incognita TaxID=6306 RepID=A0A914NZD1_MELIC
MNGIIILIIGLIRQSFHYFQCMDFYRQTTTIQSRFKNTVEPHHKMPPILDTSQFKIGWMNLVGHWMDKLSRAIPSI